ncbi:MAG: type VI secretion system protein TssA [Deltaproteobacteria bacterium]|jgi:type VI secretion system protein ImpA|nr:type VI secretion system protein TssA [Deltaproteobacteria bacterium]
MKQEIDIEAILAPIPGDNPAGEDLRYSPAYDQIKEARRADDLLDRGDWQREIKTSDWDAVITTAVDALINKSKDLQIAAWLTEALVNTEGFSGLAIGLKLLAGFLSDYWEHVYPVIEDGDLDFRIGPIELMNDKVWLAVKQVPLTDKDATPGYSWLQWQESRQVGYEADIRNQYGDVDENKKKARNASIAEGKITAEDFDAAVARSSKAYYESLAKDLTVCLEEFKRFDDTVDEKFGSEAPRLAELREALEDCERVIMKIFKEKKDLDAIEEPEPATEEAEATEVNEVEEEENASFEDVLPFPEDRILDSGSLEKAMWKDALAKLKASGIKKALGQLFSASCSAPSVREKNRYQLLMAKLCLKAERPDLARPIAEKLNILIEELQLERWESPVWIADVLDTLYKCLTTGEPTDEDIGRARALLQRLCTTDVTKAMSYRS